MSNRFTERAQRVILISQEEAKRLEHDYVGTEHILLGVICLGEGVAAQVLANLGVDLRRVRDEVEKMVGKGGARLPLGEVPFTPRAKKILEYSVEESQHMGHSYVGTEHLLLGLIREEEGIACKVLELLGLKLDIVREEVLNLLGEPTEKNEAKSMVSDGNRRVANLLYILAYKHLPLSVVTAAIDESIRMGHPAEAKLYETCLRDSRSLMERRF